MVRNDLEPGVLSADGSQTWETGTGRRDSRGAAYPDSWNRGRTYYESFIHKRRYAGQTDRCREGGGRCLWQEIKVWQRIHLSDWQMQLFCRRSLITGWRLRRSRHIRRIEKQ